MPFSTLNGTGQYARPCAAGKVRVRASAPGYEPAVGEGEASDEKGAVVSLALMPRARGEAAAAVAAAAARGDRIGTDPISAAVGVARDDVEEELGLGRRRRAAGRAAERVRVGARRGGLFPLARDGGDVRDVSRVRGGWRCGGGGRGWRSGVRGSSGSSRRTRGCDAARAIF
jgi:hypothetical protein